MSDNGNNVHFSGIRFICSPYLAIKSALASLVILHGILDCCCVKVQMHANPHANHKAVCSTVYQNVLILVELGLRLTQGEDTYIYLYQFDNPLMIITSHFFLAQRSGVK